MKRGAVLAGLIAAVFAPVALAWPGRPSGQPPKAPHPGAPPPAWIETASRSAWLAYGSYCWRTTCVDMLPPQTRPGLPVVRVGAGSLARLHLGFRSKQVTVSVDTKPVHATLDATKRVASLRVTRGGVLVVEARAVSGGSASYIARLRLG